MGSRQYAYFHISANGTYNLSRGPGFLGTVTINSPGATGNTLTIYDSLGASGSVIAVINTTQANAGSLGYDVSTGVGITAVMATGTAADVTVCYT